MNNIQFQYLPKSITRNYIKLKIKLESCRLPIIKALFSMLGSNRKLDNEFVQTSFNFRQTDQDNGHFTDKKMIVTELKTQQNIDA